MAPPPRETTAPAVPMATVATNMENAIGLTVATADQWNTAYARVMGQGIDQQFGFSFDAAYGTVSNGVRNNGATMSALLFLQQAAAQVPGGIGLSGLGAFVRYPWPSFQTTGNMIYRSHHPLPYNQTSYRVRAGLGALTSATGFEKILWANQQLRARYR